jgi:DNA-binding IclR family transcriptional regulator
MATQAGEEGANGGMQMITRAAAILGALAEPEGGRSLARLADQTGLPKTTVHRICLALERVGYVRTDDLGRRELGPRLLRLAMVARHDLRTVLEPLVERMSVDLNETVDLGVLDGDQVLYVAQHAAPQRALMAIARVGAHFPAYTLASGKALLAQLPREEILRRLPRRLEPALGGRPRTRATLLDELEEIRETGLAFEREEERHGVCAVAVAIRDPEGRTASVAVPMPTARYEASHERVAAQLLDLKHATEARLGGAGGGSDG